jgi:hypothetical protein
MEVGRSAWAKRQISVAFNDRGQPSTLDWAADSNVAAVTASLAASAGALRDEYTNTVSKLSQAASDRQTLALADLSSRLETLQKQKAILDAEVQLDAAGVNRDAAVKQQQAAADLAQLQAEASLQTAKSTADQQQQIAQLKTAVDLLKQQLELVQAQQALEKAQKGGSL